MLWKPATVRCADQLVDACLAFNKLYDALQTEQKSLLNDIEIDVSENM